MGIFRMLLAIAVLISHLPELTQSSIVSRESLQVFIWSGHAVFAFFIISGFYISMVINEKYCHLASGTKKFYINRALRLYPAHWVVLLLYALAFYLTNTPSFLLGESYGKDWLLPVAFLTNFSFFGVELLPFTDQSNWAFIIGPVWSLSLEAYFYLLAPLLVIRSLKFLILLTGGLLLIRLGMYWLDVPLLPWRYFFFPSVLVFFLIGTLSYRFYALIKHKRLSPWLGVIAGTVLFMFTISESFWLKAGAGLDVWQSWGFYAAVAVCTPFLFHLTKHHRLDNVIGQLTYPLYIGHMLVIMVLHHIDTGPVDKGLLALIGSILLSVALYYWVDKPVDRLRIRVTKTTSGSVLPQILPCALLSKFFAKVQGRTLP